MEDDGRLKGNALVPGVARDLVWNLGRRRLLAPPNLVYSVTKYARVTECHSDRHSAREKEDNN